MLNIKINSQIIPGFEYLVLLHPSLEGTQHLQFQTVLIEFTQMGKISSFQIFISNPISIISSNNLFNR